MRKVKGDLRNGAAQPDRPGKLAVPLDAGNCETGHTRPDWTRVARVFSEFLENLHAFFPSFELLAWRERPDFIVPPSDSKDRPVVPDKQLLESALLVVRWQRGDREAFAGIVELWERPLFVYLRRLAPTEADAWELLQETWLKLLRSLKSLRDPLTLPAFLYATARNTAISRFRTRMCETENYPEQVPDDRSLNDFDNLDNADQLYHALDQLSLPQREALTLFFLQDLSLEEMATLLEVPLGTVKSRLYYAKIAIRKILSKGIDHAHSNY